MKEARRKCRPYPTDADNEERGIDGEKTKGRKRHAVEVHAPNIHDMKSGILATRVHFRENQASRVGKASVAPGRRAHLRLDEYLPPPRLEFRNIDSHGHWHSIRTNSI